jgi:hypothetical protein
MVCSLLLLIHMAAYFYKVRDSMAMIMAGAIFLAKLLTGAWGQKECPRPRG